MRTRQEFSAERGNYASLEKILPKSLTGRGIYELYRKQSRASIAKKNEKERKKKRSVERCSKGKAAKGIYECI